MNVGIIYLLTAIICMFLNISILERVQSTRYKETIDMPFCDMLVFFAAFNIVDAGWGAFFSKEIIISQIGFICIGYLYHSFAAVSAYVWVGYLIHFMGLNTKNKLNLARKLLLILQIAAIASNAFTKAAFDVDVMGNYTTGPARKILYMLQFSYYIVLTVYGFVKVVISHEEKRLYKNAIIFSIVPFIFSIFQYIFLDMAMYSLGFAFSAVVIYSYNVTSQRERFMEEKFGSISRKQASIIHGLAGDFMSIYYVDMETGGYDIYKNDIDSNSLVEEKHTGENFFDYMINVVTKNVVEEDKDKFIECLNKDAIRRELSDKNEFVFITRILWEGIPHYYEYKFVWSLESRDKSKLIIGVYNVDDEVRNKIIMKEITEKLTADAYIDALTGLYNRRAYEENIRDYIEKIDNKDFVYISMDVNGLKSANDNLGHEAGDELIVGAAQCMKQCFDNYGRIYRIGGDEFVVIMFADESHLKNILEEFDNSLMRWTGQKVSELSISYGSVSISEFPNMGILEISKIADQKMYQSKARYYAHKGVDRRGNNEAFKRLYTLYIKIVKLNIIENKYFVIKLDEEEMPLERRINGSFSRWVTEFANMGLIHEEDRESFLSSMSNDNLMEYFADGNKYFCIYYRRKDGDVFKRAMLEIVLADDYSEENPIVFLYVKNV